jgi:tetratricopeptide (TPR) repeat protein
MAQILKLPIQPSKLGYKRVRRRCHRPDSPNQLDLFTTAPSAQILAFENGLGPFEQALLLDERGDPRANQLYNEAIEKKDCVADAFCNLGILETQRGDSVRALDCFTTALKHDPRHAEAHYNLGNLYFELNDLRLAEIHFEMAGRADEGFANAFYNLALVKTIGNNPAGAANALAQYKALVSEQEGRAADDMIEELRRSLPILALRDSHSVVRGRGCSKG